MKKITAVLFITSLLFLATYAIADPQWSATTLEAANSDAAKDVLRKGKPATIAGEIVDVSCYLQLGKRGEKHIDCGSKCVQNGQPIGIVDDNGKLTLVMVEEHHPRRDGQLSIRDKFAALMGKQARVEGMLTETEGNAALFVTAEPGQPDQA